MGRVPYGPQPIFLTFIASRVPARRCSQAAQLLRRLTSRWTAATASSRTTAKRPISSDFLNNGVQGPNDPFNEFYSGNTWQQLTTVDYKELDALGFPRSDAGHHPDRQDDQSCPDRVSYFVESDSERRGTRIEIWRRIAYAGEFGSIAPVGAVQTGAGYDIAWQIPGTNQFTFWTTDSSGNYTSNIVGLVREAASRWNPWRPPSSGPERRRDNRRHFIVDPNGRIASLLQIADNYLRIH